MNKQIHYTFLNLSLSLSHTFFFARVFFVNIIYYNIINNNNNNRNNEIFFVAFLFKSKYRLDSIFLLFFFFIN